MKILWFLLQKIGEDPKRFGTHSFCRGAATRAFKAGALADLIKEQGDWKNEEYHTYIELSLNDRLRLAK